MARRRFFVDVVRNGEAIVEGDDAQHLTRVLRVEPGELYEISDNVSAYLAEITEAHKRRVVFSLREPVAPKPPAVRLTLCAALVKFDHFEWMIEKATELGVARIAPFRAARSERGLDQAAGKRVDRWRRIALEASQQSRRDHLPVIDESVDFEDVLTIEAGGRYACDEEPGAAPFLAAIPPARSTEESVAILIGPEGGWTAGERELFLDRGWTAVSLGNQVLRAETAAMAALAVAGAAWQCASPPVIGS